MKLSTEDLKIIKKAIAYVKANWDHARYYFFRGVDDLEKRLEEAKPDRIEATLHEGDKEVGVVVEVEGNSVWIDVEGYGTFDGRWPIRVEIYEGRLQVMAWPDILSEDTRIIDMEGARLPDNPDDMPTIEPWKMAPRRWEDERDEDWYDEDELWGEMWED